MCGRSSPPAATTTMAAAPAPPAPSADEPEIGTGRKKESREEFGTDVPNYRVSRNATSAGTVPGQIQM